MRLGLGVGLSNPAGVSNRPPAGQAFVTVTDQDGKEQVLTVTDSSGVERPVTVYTG